MTEAIQALSTAISSVSKSDVIQILAALIGGILAAGTGWPIERQRQKGQLKQARRMFTRAINDDLSYSLQLYDKVSEEWEKTKIVWFQTINELRESRQPYLNNKDWSLVFDDERLRQSIFRYYLQSADRMNLLEQAQRRKYELERTYNDVVRNIQIKEQNITPEEARKAAIRVMENENKEYDNLVAEIPNHVGRLVALKATAQSLISQIQQRK